jgi:hypothetical protein
MSTPTPGDEIELVYTDDEYTSLTPGDKGVVTGINEHPPEISPENNPETQIEVKWNNGSTLNLIDSQDEYEIIEQNDN